MRWRRARGTGTVKPVDAQNGQVSKQAADPRVADLKRPHRDLPPRGKGTKPNVRNAAATHTAVEVAPNDPGTDSGPGSGTASRR